MSLKQEDAVELSPRTRSRSHGRRCASGKFMGCAAFGVQGILKTTLPYGRFKFLRVCVAAGDKACRQPALLWGNTHPSNLVTSFCCVRHLRQHSSVPSRTPPLLSVCSALLKQVTGRCKETSPAVTNHSKDTRVGANMSMLSEAASVPPPLPIRSQMTSDPVLLVSVDERPGVDECPSKCLPL